MNVTRLQASIVIKLTFLYHNYIAITTLNRHVYKINHEINITHLTTWPNLPNYTKFITRYGGFD